MLSSRVHTVDGRLDVACESRTGSPLVDILSSGGRVHQPSACGRSAIGAFEILEHPQCS